jgi:hypothetical protein
MLATVPVKSVSITEAEDPESNKTLLVASGVDPVDQFAGFDQFPLPVHVTVAEIAEEPVKRKTAKIYKNFFNGLIP